MALGTQVPWTYPGGPPCCCNLGCSDVFDETFWINGSSVTGRGITESQAILLDIDEALAQQLYAGGTFNVEITSSLSISGGNGCLFSASSSVAGEQTVMNSGGCYGAALNASTASVVASVTSATTGAIVTTNASVSPVGTSIRPTGSGSANPSSTIRISYQIIEDGSIYKLYVGAFGSIGTGTVQIAQSGGVTFQGGGSMEARSNLSGASVINVDFCGVTFATAGAQFAVQGNYGLNTVTSATGSIDVIVTHTPSAP